MPARRVGELLITSVDVPWPWPCGPGIAAVVLIIRKLGNQDF